MNASYFVFFPLFQPLGPSLCQLLIASLVTTTITTVTTTISPEVSHNDSLLDIACCIQLLRNANVNLNWCMDELVRK